MTAMDTTPPTPSPASHFDAAARDWKQRPLPQ